MPLPAAVIVVSMLAAEVSRQQLSEESLLALPRDMRTGHRCLRAMTGSRFLFAGATTACSVAQKTPTHVASQIGVVRKHTTLAGDHTNLNAGHLRFGPAIAQKSTLNNVAGLVVMNCTSASCVSLRILSSSAGS